MEVAVIGSGAAAAGVLAGLERYAPGARATVFDIGGRLTDPPAGLAARGFTHDQLVPLYRTLHGRHGMVFSPPKSHFGEALTKLDVDDRPMVWKSEHRGGLTNVWGGGMFPFTDRELRGW